MKTLITAADRTSALARGRALLASPHATSASFVGRSALLKLQYSNGIGYLIDVRHAPALKGEPLTRLRNVYLTAGGDGLVFEDADIALSLPNLLAHFVTLEVARSRVAAEHGRATSPQKAAAARANGAKGGRPRKQTAEPAEQAAAAPATRTAAATRSTRATARATTRPKSR